MKFQPGQIMATPGALDAFRASGESPLAFLERHLAGDWGELDESDVRENELSLREGFRLLSAYTLRTGVKILDHYGSRPQRDDIPAAGRILNDLHKVSSLPSK
jgi:hypothetical protein